MWKVAVIIFLLGSAGCVTLPPPGTPIQAPSFAPSIAKAASIAASAPAVGRSFGASIVGQSGVCRIPLNGGTLINAPLDKGNPMASNIQPYSQPPIHAAHADSADGFIESLEGAVTLAVTGATLIGTSIAAIAADPQHGIEGLPDAAVEEGQAIEMAANHLAEGVEGIADGQPYNPVMEEAEGADHLGNQIEGLGENAAQGAADADQVVAEGAEGLAASQPGEAGAQAAEAEAAAGEPVGLGAEVGGAIGGEAGIAVEAGVTAGLDAGVVALQTAQADNVPLNLQDGDVATADSSIKAAQNRGISNPVQRAMQAGKKQDPSVQAPLAAFQNILVLAPQQAVMAKTPSALPSAIQAGLATPVKPSAVASGGRKMLQSAPDCCNTYTVKPGDTLASIATAYGQPTNGARIMQAVNGLSGDVAPGQSIMLPCGRLLSYINAYNVGALTKATAVNAAAG